MPTIADELRAAAEKIRRDAEAAHRASPAPWHVTGENVVRCTDGMIVADRSGTDHPAERADLPYIAAMHPSVGTALADWLDATVAALEKHAPAEWHARLEPQALAVARQINGGAQ